MINITKLHGSTEYHLPGVRRDLLVAYWGGALPTANPTTITTGYTGASYRDVQPSLIASVTRLLCQLPGTTSTAEVHLIYPSATPSGRLAIIIGGHGGSYYDPTYGEDAMVLAALTRGDYVLGVCVPLMGLNPSSMIITRPNGGDVTCTTHDQLAVQVTKGGICGLHYWIDQIVLSLNYAIPLLAPKLVWMFGFSNGGWTAEWTAAVDPRITKTYSASGSNPYGFLDGTGAEWQGQADQEQTQYYDATSVLKSWWPIVGDHRMLYALCSYPSPRTFVHMTTVSDKFFGQSFNVQGYVDLERNLRSRNGNRASTYVDPYNVADSHLVTANEIAVVMAASV
jgi:hypothetical protein